MVKDSILMETPMTTSTRIITCTQQLQVIKALWETNTSLLRLMRISTISSQFLTTMLSIQSNLGFTKVSQTLATFTGLPV